MRCVLVSHTHWDREWYRTFEAFRARLVDVVDRVLDLVAADPGFRFVLDGQTVIVEDYLAIRPGRRAELEAACRAGRVTIGPWYVQPDSLLPSGEALMRNLLEGRRAGLGPISQVAYCPDSFGHPAQLPQLFAGFGLGPFIYWRGNGDEIETLPAEYRWEAPDGSSVLAHHLREGYFAASGLPRSSTDAATWLAGLARDLATRSRSDVILLMNGFDHAPPEAHAGAVAETLAHATGWTVLRGVLDDFAALLPTEAPAFRGELLGARTANLLPGVWSTRMPLKLRNRRGETALEGWAEPWTALAAVHGAADERPALRRAWRALLQNQAHDSICGCSQDRVHAQMMARFDAAEELAHETTTRALERLAGLDVDRDSPWDTAYDVGVFNPSPHPRTDVVRFRPIPRRWMAFGGGVARQLTLHPWLFAADGYEADGRPASLVPDESTDRIRLLPDVPAQAIEFVVRDVPAFGWRRVRLRKSAAHPSTEDDGRAIAVDAIAVEAAADGTLAVRIGDRRWDGLAAVEDVGDRGDSYDFDPVPDGTVTLEAVHARRRLHATGVQTLRVDRIFGVPAALSDDRRARSHARAALALETTVQLVPGTARIDLEVRLTNTASDHRLRLRFPTGSAVAGYTAATTFDVARRGTAPGVVSGWVHPAPTTFPHQGFVHANGLTVVAPGLPEAEVTPDGTIVVTLLRAVGWLARLDLATRPQPAGPSLPVPGAQCLGPIEARLALLAGLDVGAARDAELGLAVVTAGAAPLLPPDRPLVEITPRSLVLSALKPAENGDGIVLRLLNPTDAEVTARVRLGFPVTAVVPVRLDETESGPPLVLADDGFAMGVRPHGLASAWIRPQNAGVVKTR